ncbi:DNase I-like protein [Myriangium duriaei CBS 260.36]|uniref:DNase I-like protein n=1 Tax=Myriangium duriaei CBS 260.36 TaxID=1168546 RepID=A0A9P4MFR4_9PEZI|nr:DNase I-like protein [Myriangium duriaei CBS 260.36]
MTDTAAPSRIRIISLNCWGLKFISKYRNERLSHIGSEIAAANPLPEIVGLQECWTQEDYLEIRRRTKHILPYGKFYHSGIFGGGLAILSKWRIEESNMVRYPLNGRPAAFYRGDWFVGKGVACARIRFGPGKKDVVEVFCTHLHAPYEREPNDSYICHRTAQAWEIAKLMRHAAERGHLVVGLGDFNMIPLSLAHRLIEAHSPVRDVWRILFPDSAIGPAHSSAEKARGRPTPTADEAIEKHGATCDSKYNTWRWEKQLQKNLAKGEDSHVDGSAPDPNSQRLDYIFVGADPDTAAADWMVEAVNVGMTGRHPELKCSLSDHFSIEATVVRREGRLASEEMDEMMEKGGQALHMSEALPLQTYDEILAMIRSYDLRERRQRRLRLSHFGVELAISIGCLVASWFAPRNFVCFILVLVSTLGLSAGVLDGLMGGLFVGSELRALKEFQWEIENARRAAEATDD